MKNIICLLDFFGQFFAMGIGNKKEFVKTAFVFRIQQFFQKLIIKDIKMFDFIIDYDDFNIKIFRFFQSSKHMGESKISWRIYIGRFLQVHYSKDNFI